MPADVVERGLIDTNVVVLRQRIDPAELPDELAISTVTLAELSAGPHQVGPGRGYDEVAERARRLEILQRVEHEFDPLPFDADAARAYGRIVAAVVGVGRTPRRRVADLMIASIALSQRLPLYTTNPDDFVGLRDLLSVVAVTRPG